MWLASFVFRHSAKYNKWEDSQLPGENVIWSSGVKEPAKHIRWADRRGITEMPLKTSLNFIVTMFQKSSAAEASESVYIWERDKIEKIETYN